MARICVWPVALISLFTTLAVKAAQRHNWTRARTWNVWLTGSSSQYGRFLYDRVNVHRFPDEAAQQYQTLIRDLTSTKYEVEALIKLLSTTTPRCGR